MRKCVLHIGMHKTGSSSIQESLRGYVDDDFVYPELDHATTTLGLFSSDFARIFEARQALGKNREGFDRRVVEKTLRRAIRISGKRTMILSCEGLYANLSEADLIAMKAYLSDWFSDFEVIAYLRSPVSFRSSAFQAGVKSNKAASFHDSRKYKQYRLAFEKFDRVFGRERTFLFKFQRSLFPAGDVVRHFCAHLGLPIDEGRILHVNSALSREIVAILYVLNRMSSEGGNPEVDRMIVRACSTSGLGGTPFRLSPGPMERMLANYADDLDWIEDRIGHPMRDTEGDERPTDVRGEKDLLRPDDGVEAVLRELSKRYIRPEARQRFGELVGLWQHLSRGLQATDVVA